MTYPLRVALVAFFFFLGFSSLKFATAQSNTVDHCAIVGQKFFSGAAVYPSEYRACLKSFPFRPYKARAFLNTFWKVMTMIYPYINISRNSPWPQLKLQAKIRRDLGRIKKKTATYKTDFEFQKDLHLLLRSLNDGHTGWAPSCHMVAQAVNGFPLYQYYSTYSNTTKIQVAAVQSYDAIVDSSIDIIGLTEQLLNINILDYSNALVVKINGIPAREYAKQYARTVGGYRDQQQRLNSLFVRPTDRGSILLGALNAPEFLPDTDFVEYTLIKYGSSVEETLKVPFLLYYNGPSFNSADDYFSMYCDTPPEPSLSDSYSPFAKFLGSFLNNVPKKVPEMTFQSPKASAALASFQAQSSVDPSYFYAGPLDDDTALLIITDFQGQGGIRVLAQLLTAYNKLKNLGLSKLLIDVTDNGGGISISASYLTELLFPGGGDPQYTNQFKAPPFTRTATRRAAQNLYVNASYPRSDYDWREYEDYRTDVAFKDASQFFFPLKTLTQAGVTAAFSSPFQLGYTYNDYNNTIDSTGTDYLDSSLPTEPLFKPENILILSNGLCFSTCAIFTSMMNQRHGVKVVTLGGRQTDGPFSYSAGFVGFVVPDYTESYYKPNVLNLGLQNLPSAPKALTFPGSLYFVLAQAYGLQNPKIPAEFVYTPSQFHMKQTIYNVLDRAQQWLDAITFFDS